LGFSKKLIRTYESDASHIRGKAADVALPNTISEVRKIISQTRRIVPRGGGTGLAGGAVPQNGQDVVLELSKLTEIGNFDRERKTIEVEAGVVLDDLQHHLEKFNLIFPVRPASHAAATIGGMIATDAVGMRAIKYGRTSKWVKWVEIIDDHGNLERKGMTELSDYTGMEGITGVIVRACLKLSPKKERTGTLVPVNDTKEVVSIVQNLKRNSQVSMIEFMDKQISEGIGLEKKDHLIIEYEDNTGVLKGEEYQKLLKTRERVYPFLAGEGFIRIEDPKIMIDKFPKLMAWLREKGIPVFGHVSVGILHPCFNKEQSALIPELMKLVKGLGGQITGEHGVGIIKREFVEANDKKILINVKKRTDPMNKFNVGKVI
jgi:glycolate oxidase